jgi:hypothetical protein
MSDEGDDLYSRLKKSQRKLEMLTLQVRARSRARFRARGAASAVLRARA